MRISDWSSDVCSSDLSGEPFPFWGHGGGERPFLLRRGRRPHGPDDLPERRLCEWRIRRVQPTWKLAGNGSVGGQMLTGIPRVWQFRRGKSEEHTSELQSLMRISYAVFCLKTKKTQDKTAHNIA